MKSEGNTSLNKADALRESALRLLGTLSAAGLTGDTVEPHGFTDVVPFYLSRHLADACSPSLRLRRASAIPQWLNKCGLLGRRVKHRSKSDGPGAFTHSQHIGNATFARNLCETPGAVSRVTSHRSQRKTPSTNFCGL